MLSKEMVEVKVEEAAAALKPELRFGGCQRGQCTDVEAADSWPARKAGAYSRFALAPAGLAGAI